MHLARRLQASQIWQKDSFWDSAYTCQIWRTVFRMQILSNTQERELYDLSIDPKTGRLFKQAAALATEPPNSRSDLHMQQLVERRLLYWFKACTPCLRVRRVWICNSKILLSESNKMQPFGKMSRLYSWTKRGYQQGSSSCRQYRQKKVLFSDTLRREAKSRFLQVF